MSIAGLAASSFFSGNIAHSTQTLSRQLQQEFERLGQDIQTGNVHQAQADLAILKTDLPPATATQGQGATVAQKFQQLSQDLQSGDLAGAQADFINLRQAARETSVPSSHHHRHPIRANDFESAATGVNGPTGELGQAFQRNTIAAASAVTVRRYNNRARMDRPSLLSTSA